MRPRFLNGARVGLGGGAGSASSGASRRQSRRDPLGPSNRWDLEWRKHLLDHEDHLDCE